MKEALDIEDANAGLLALKRRLRELMGSPSEQYERFEDRYEALFGVTLASDRPDGLINIMRTKRPDKP